MEFRGRKKRGRKQMNGGNGGRRRGRERKEGRIERNGEPS